MAVSSAWLPAVVARLRRASYIALNRSAALWARPVGLGLAGRAEGTSQACPSGCGRLDERERAHRHSHDPLQIRPHILGEKSLFSWQLCPLVGCKRPSVVVVGIGKWTVIQMFTIKIAFAKCSVDFLLS